jgi:AcrR family transcriptional regulator
MTQKGAVTIGRPRNFDMDEALGRALEVFWRKGYEGATICDLTAAMAINPPSLYAAFGNKEGLFCKALERYADKNEAFLQEALSQPKARDGIAALLRVRWICWTTNANPSAACFSVGVPAAYAESDWAGVNDAPRSRGAPERLRSVLKPASCSTTRSAASPTYRNGNERLAAAQRLRAEARALPQA